MIFADPPYWMRVEGTLERADGTNFNGCNDVWDQFESLDAYKDFTRKWISECLRVLKPNGSFWVIGGLQCIYTIGAIMQDLGMWFINDVVWFKANPTPNFKGTRLNNSHETMIWATKNKSAKYTFNYKTGKALNDGKQLGSVWRVGICQGNERLKDADGHKLHTTQKPLDLLYRVIAINSKPGDVILDPFGGTMTTGVMAKRMGRKYIMIEMDEKYCRYGQERLDSTAEIMGDIENATFDIKPAKVSFSQMINDGYFDVGEKLYYNNQPYGLLTSDGKIQLLSDNSISDIHSSIASIKHSKAKRLNGWDFWEVKRGQVLIPISHIRQQYRER